MPPESQPPPWPFQFSDPPQCEQPQRPFQFSLRHLLVAMLALSVVLALVAQLWHIGFVAAVFLLGIALGAWRRDGRLAAAASTALIIYVVTYAAAWMVAGNDEVLLERMIYRELRWQRYLKENLEEYARTRGEYPAALADLPQLADTLRTDTWGNPYEYRKLDRGFELASLGQDGKRGGTGLDADIELPSGAPNPPARLPIGQFLFHTPLSGTFFWIATLASASAAAIWYAAQHNSRRGTVAWLASLLVTTASAVVVALFLAMIHLAFEQASGH